MKTAFREREPIRKILDRQDMTVVAWYSQSLDDRTLQNPATKGGWCNVMLCQWALETAAGTSCDAFWQKMQTPEMAQLLWAKGEEKLRKKAELPRDQYVKLDCVTLADKFTPGKALPSRYLFDSATEIIGLLNTTDQPCFLMIKIATENDAERHAVGVFRIGKELHFLDPNYVHFKCHTLKTEAFILAFREVFSGIYATNRSICAPLDMLSGKEKAQEPYLTAEAQLFVMK